MSQQTNKTTYRIFYLKVFLVTIVVSSLAVLAIFIGAHKPSNTNSTSSNPSNSKSPNPISTASAVPSKENKPAPLFTMPNLTTSGSTSLSGLRGKVVVVNFWASWCTACKFEAPLLAHISSVYQAKGVKFLGVDVNDKNAPALQFRQKYNLTFPSVVDPQAKVASTYGVFGLPSTFIINKSGVIKYQVIGAIGQHSFPKALNQVIKTGK